MSKAWRLVTALSVVVLVAATAEAAREERAEGPEGAGQSAEMQRPGGARGPHGDRGREGPGGRFLERMLESKTANEIGLDEAQIQTLKNGLERLNREEEALREKLAAAGKAQAELMMTEGELDEVAIMNAVDATGRIRTEMAKLRIQPILLVKKTLTPQQLTKVRKHMRAGGAEFREKKEGRREKMEGRRKERENRREQARVRDHDGDDDDVESGDAHEAQE